MNSYIQKSIKGKSIITNVDLTGEITIDDTSLNTYIIEQFTSSNVINQTSNHFDLNINSSHFNTVGNVLNITNYSSANFTVPDYVVDTFTIQSAMQLDTSNQLFLNYNPKHFNVLAANDIPNSEIIRNALGVSTVVWDDLQLFSSTLDATAPLSINALTNNISLNINTQNLEIVSGSLKLKNLTNKTVPFFDIDNMVSSSTFTYDDITNTMSVKKINIVDAITDSSDNNLAITKYFLDSKITQITQGNGIIVNRTNDAYKYPTSIELSYNNKQFSMSGGNLQSSLIPVENSIISIDPDFKITANFNSNFIATSGNLSINPNGTIASSLISTGSLYVNNTLNSSLISTGSLYVNNTLSSLTISTSNIYASNISVGNLSCGNIYIRNELYSSLISTGSLYSSSISAGNISTANIVVKDYVNSAVVSAGSCHSINNYSEHISAANLSSNTGTIGNLLTQQIYNYADRISIGSFINSNATIANLRISNTLNITSISVGNIISNNATIDNLIVSKLTTGSMYSTQATIGYLYSPHLSINKSGSIVDIDKLENYGNASGDSSLVFSGNTIKGNYSGSSSITLTSNSFAISSSVQTEINRINGIDSRLTTAESNIGTINTNISGHETRIIALEGQTTALIAAETATAVVASAAAAGVAVNSSAISGLTTGVAGLATSISGIDTLVAANSLAIIDALFVANSAGGLASQNTTAITALGTNINTVNISANNLILSNPTAIICKTLTDNDTLIKFENTSGNYTRMGMYGSFFDYDSCIESTKKFHIQLNNNRVLSLSSNGNLNVPNGLFTNGIITNITSTNAVLTNISSSNIIVSNISTSNCYVSNIFSSNISTTTLITTNASSTNGLFTNLSSANIKTNSLTISGNDTSYQINTVNLYSDNAAISNIGSSNISTSNLTSSNITSTNAVLTNISSSNIIVSNLTSSNLISSNLYLSGNQGINTINPRNQLEIYGTSNTSGIMLYSGFNDSGYNNIYFNHSDNNSNYLKSVIRTQALGSGNCARSNMFLCVNTLNDSSNVSNADSKIFISGNTGYIGIGNTSPNYSLDITGNLNVSNIIVSNLTSSNLISSNLYLSGNQGINTVNPRNQLEIYGTSNTSGIMLYSGFVDSGYNNIYFNHSDNNSNYIKSLIRTQAIGTGQYARSNMMLCVNIINDSSNVSNSDSKLFISGNTGYIGIGNTSPNYSLDITGNLNVSNIISSNITSSNVFTTNLTSSNVLIKNNNTNACLSINSFSINSFSSITNSIGLSVKGSYGSCISLSDNLSESSIWNIKNNYKELFAVNNGLTFNNNIAGDVMSLNTNGNVLVNNSLISSNVNITNANILNATIANLSINGLLITTGNFINSNITNSNISITNITTANIVNSSVTNCNITNLTIGNTFMPTFTTFTSGSGTYTPPSGCKYLKITAVGASGAAGGYDGSGIDGGAGSGSGATCILFSSKLTSYSYAVGAAGTGNVGYSSVGNSGGNTTFSNLTGSPFIAMNAGGSLGASQAGSDSGSPAIPSDGGVASGGDINLKGNPGFTPAGYCGGGSGGASSLGGAGIGKPSHGGTVGQNGSGSSGRGSGNAAGVNGSNGIIIIEEHYI